MNVGRGRWAGGLMEVGCGVLPRGLFLLCGMWQGHQSRECWQCEEWREGVNELSQGERGCSKEV